tara:strand:- start:566 stop:931 length:366 start_codon:yes stop_codon:yes gene_type:complete
MTEDKVVKKLKENFYKRIDKHDELQFLDSSTLNHALCLEIAECTFAEKAISYEDLCHQIPRKLGSRSTILNSLNYAVAEGYFIKESVDYDKRIKNYKLSSNFKTVMIDWINELKSVTSEID